MIKAVLFDLDGTLLPMDQGEFVRCYFGLLASYMAPFGIEAKGLFSTIWEGVGAMVANDGSRTNDEAFWEVFERAYGPEAAKNRPLLEAFYEGEFLKSRSTCHPVAQAAAAVRHAKDLGFEVALATNPIFPEKATFARLSWTGLAPEDFSFVTTYENWGTAKPNPAYFLQVARKLGLEPGECAMVGNDAREDGAALEAGMRLFLLADCLIAEGGAVPEGAASGGWGDLDRWLDALPR